MFTTWAGVLYRPKPVDRPLCSSDICHPKTSIASFAQPFAGYMILPKCKTSIELHGTWQAPAEQEG